MTLGQRLKKLREGKGLNQSDTYKNINFMYETNINGSMWSKWENDRDTPTMDYLRILSNYFETSLDYLAGISDEVKRHNSSTLEGNLKVLFSVAEDLSPEDVAFLTQMAKKMKGE